MNDENVGHLEFWTQFRGYLDDHKIDIQIWGQGWGQVLQSSNCMR